MSKTRSTSSVQGCPCGHPISYEQCCGRYHAGPLALQAPDPESLMRSRYSAFVLDLRPYLLDTWHASERPEAIEAPESGLQWLGLSVREASLTGEGEGRVSFVARFKIGGRAHRLAEVSRFVFEQGRWWYVKAVSPDSA